MRTLKLTDKKKNYNTMTEINLKLNKAEFAALMAAMDSEIEQAAEMWEEDGNSGLIGKGYRSLVKKLDAQVPGAFEHLMF
jgi:hypothetical protein